MKYFFFNNRINFLFLFISFICLVSVLGFENISFYSTKWLYGVNDAGQFQLGWYFFQNDVWRFPLGSNPNYGDEIGSSIVYSGSMPGFAIFFKLLNPFFSGNFQYFSFFYLLCFYLQLFFSFKILKEFTNSNIHSVIGSLFFLIAPIFIWKVNWHGSVAAQWLFLIALYLGLTQKIDKAKWSWNLLIILALLIEYSYAIMLVAAYSLLRIFNLKFKKEKIFQLIKDFFVITLIVLPILYIVGYFEIRLGDTLGVGFGHYKLNLLSIFDPVNSVDNISWSWFLPDIKLTRGEEIEGFNYLGLGQFIMLFFALTLLFNKNYKTNLISIKNNNKIRHFVIISFFFFFWALSNKISFGSYTLLEIPLNKYILALFTLMKNTGRIFILVNYFLLTLSIVIIFKCFNKKNSLLIITLFLIIQVADISAGLKNRINFFTPLNVNERIGLKDQIWEDLFKKYKVVKTTYPISWPGHFGQFSYAMEKHKIEKTNLVVLARINRKKAAEARYHLYDNFHKKNLASDIVYVIDNLGHLRHLKHIFKDENVGFFYRDNVWAMVMNEKERMNDGDIKAFNKVKPKLLDINEEKNLNFGDKDNYSGFGWSHNSGKPGIWSEGPMSTLLFRTKKNYGDLKLEISCRPYITKKNNISELDIYVNNSFNKNVKLTNNNQDETFEILINEKIIENNEIKIDFNFKNPISPYEVLESPDSRKLGISVKNIKLNSI